MRTLAALVLFLLGTIAFAGDTGGIVRGVYYQASPGVMVDAGMLR